MLMSTADSFVKILGIQKKKKIQPSCKQTEGTNMHKPPYEDPSKSSKPHPEGFGETRQFSIIFQYSLS